MLKKIECIIQPFKLGGGKGSFKENRGRGNDGNRGERVWKTKRIHQRVCS